MNTAGLQNNQVVHAQRLQVEEKKRGVAPGTPVAIQQHQDIIAANYPARAAGVKKHMRPAEVPSCTRRLNSIGCLLLMMLTAPT